ncbi:MAG: DUF1805 domain-containing protein [Candidatus Omnitrophota bacterium]
MEKFSCDKIIIEGIEIDTYVIQMPQARLILVVAAKGYIMCGYLDIATAGKLEDAACIVTGVKTVKELLEKPVVKITKQAEMLGISLGMSGKEALAKML